jgi:hypothetical protein
MVFEDLPGTGAGSLSAGKLRMSPSGVIGLAAVVVAGVSVLFGTGRKVEEGGRSTESHGCVAAPIA